MAALSSDRVFGLLLHDWTRRAVALAVGVLTWRELAEQGWPWWAWLPAAILGVMVGYLLMMLLAYAYQKSTYQIRARLIKEQLRQSLKDTTVTGTSESRQG